MVIKCPCKGCEERHENCHSNCESYAKYKQEKAEFSSIVFEQKKNTRRINSYYAELDRKIKKKKAK